MLEPRQKNSEKRESINLTKYKNTQKFFTNLFYREFFLDESEGNDLVEDEARFHSYDEPQLPFEALFLVGRRTRFGRTIRFNRRFIK